MGKLAAARYYLRALALKWHFICHFDMWVHFLYKNGVAYQCVRRKCCARAYRRLAREISAMAEPVKRNVERVWRPVREMSRCVIWHRQYLKNGIRR